MPTRREPRGDTALDRLFRQGEDKALRRELVRLAAAALVDPLTSLRNRRGLERDLEERVALATRGGRPLTVVVGDLDGLKAINDRKGHAAGDQALRAMGAALASALRAGDTAYRIGGDEFLLVLPDTDAQAAERVVARVSRKAPSFGWGAATLPADGVDGSRLIELADQRLLGRRNACRGRSGVVHRTSQPTRRHHAGRAVTYVSLVVVAVLSGVGLGFAADNVIGRDQQHVGLPMRGPVTTATAGPPAASSTDSTLTDTAETADTAEDRVLGAAVSAMGPRTTTTTAGIIAALIEEAVIEPFSPTIAVPGSDVVIPLEPLEPAEVLGEIVVRDPDLEPDLDADPDAAAKPVKQRRPSEKHRGPETGATDH